MCYYRYVYYSRCQHAEFYKYTYCDEAKALGQPQRDAQRELDDAASNAHPHNMSTLTPTEVGGARKLPDSPHRVRLPRADLVPRSIQHDAPLTTPGYRNLNIDIPLDTQSSVSMELTQDGKVLEPVARCGADTDSEGSDTPQAHGDRTRASSASTIRPFDGNTSAVEAGTPTPPRKSLPAQWTTTPRAPVLMTQMRGEEREKRKSNGQDASPVSPRTIHGSTSGSPLRKSKSTIKITVSPTRPSLLSSDSHARTTSVSTDESVFHSARHSPVSQLADRVQSSACSPTSFVTANEQHDGVSHYALSEADDLQKPAPGTVFSSLARASTLSGVKSLVAGKTATTRPTAPKLSLRIPHTSSSTDRKPPFVLGSASSSGSPASPSRSSRIPRATPTESSVKATSAKRTQDKLPAASKSTISQAKHVRTVNSTGTTPIINREALDKGSHPDKHAMVTSYLEKVEPSPDFAKGIAEQLSKSSSRVSSTSTVMAKPVSDPVADPVLQDVAVVSYRKQSDATASESLPTASPARGRSTEYVPHDRKQTRSDLSATAPEFVPSQQETAYPTQQANNNFPLNLFGLDMYGIPWFYHMYPVPIQGPVPRSPRKRRTFPQNPQNRKRGGSSPHKAFMSTSAPGGSTAENESVPFSAQLEEIARHAAVRHGKSPQKGLGSNFQTTPTRNRHGRDPCNGLYDTFGRGRGRQVGLPIDATTPFPTPVPPSGRRNYVGHMIVKREPTCGVINIERAAEWGGAACNKCEPDH